jgi:dUTP pyrophosphatase
LQIAIVTLDHYKGLDLPAYQTADAAGMDLRCAEMDAIVLAPMERRAARTGIQIAIPRGYEGQVRPRSGLALKKGVGIVNSPGTIDADYRGEILVPLINWNTEPVTIERGTRIAQLVIAPIQQIAWKPVASLEDSARGIGGFGHTGLH